VSLKRQVVMVQFLSIFFPWISSIFIGFFKSSHFLCHPVYCTKPINLPVCVCVCEETLLIFQTILIHLRNASSSARLFLKYSTKMVGVMWLNYEPILLVKEKYYNCRRTWYEVTFCIIWYRSAVTCSLIL